MPLERGTRFGPYEIVRPLGAGGMGEVYQAVDTRLDRTVAIKIMPDALAADPQFRERFEREARTISQLDHPNICALYDVGEDRGTSYLVMQYLEGDTLGARLTGGPLPLGDALQVAVEIAGALTRAHKAGVVHRDLKPGNVMLTRSGAKLLDFGIAKTQITAASTSVMATTPAGITAPGAIIGTLQYMAPEQLEGRDADTRTDIFSFGALLYEMVTGRPAFSGTTQASLAGAIMRDDPMTTAHALATVPPSLRLVLRTCLAKEPDDRFQTIQDLGRQLQWIRDAATSGSGLTSAVTPDSAAAAAAWTHASGVGTRPLDTPRRQAWVPWTVAALAMLAAIGGAAFALTRPAPPLPRIVRFEVNNPEGTISIGAPRVSPDGRYLAFNGTDATGVTKIWVRQMHALIAQPLPGTEGSARPFWSPDSRWIGYVSQGKLMKIDAAGGPAQTICDAPRGSDGTWSSEGVILFDGRGADPIYRVPASGGTPVAALRPDASRGEQSVAWPEFLPDGRHFIYLAQHEKADESTYRIGQLDSEQSQPFSSGQTMLSYAPPGYLLFLRDQTLVAQPFDATTMKTTGDMMPLAERIGTDIVGLGAFSVSREGTLAYRVGETSSRLLQVDRTGRELDTLGEPGDYSNPSISPDGSRLAFTLRDRRTARPDLWVRDLARGVNSRLTFGQADGTAPVWSPDGAALAFRSGRDGAADLYVKQSNGQGQETVLLKNAFNKLPTDWSRDGRYILYQEQDPKSDWGVWALPTFGDRTPIPIVNGPFNESNGQFSPDGRFVLYRSTESGRSEIYVQSFPAGTGKWQVSNTGGVDPAWRADGREITYRALDQRMMSAEIALGSTVRVSVPQPLFAALVSESGNARNRYTMTPDAQRLIFLAPPRRDAVPPTTVVLNWSADLHR